MSEKTLQYASNEKFRLLAAMLLDFFILEDQANFLFETRCNQFLGLFVDFFGKYANY
jgi:hypothetical protein